MKLASLAGGRDGRLVVVSDDLAWCAEARDVAPTLQAALDDWRACVPALRALSLSLATGGTPRDRFHEHEALAPLPRAHQWIDGSAYLNHMELVRRQRGVEMPPNLRTEPLVYQGGSDGFLGARDDLPLEDEAWGCDLEAEVAVIVDDVPRGADRATAAAAIRLVTLVNDVSLRELIRPELAKGFGFFQSKPASAFAPVAITPDALGSVWDGGRLHGALETYVNGAPLGQVDPGVDLAFDFPDLIVHAARTRSLGAGTIVGSGTVSNRGADGGPGLSVRDGGAGYSCLAEQRTVEALVHGEARTPYLRVGDTLRIEMRDSHRHPMFGAIEQRVVAG